MYGIHSYPLHLEEDGITIDVTEKNGTFFYKRNVRGSVYECILSSKEGKIHINPVEPVNLPSHITDYMEIHFDRIMVAPKSEYTCYLKFPIEIGVFYKSGESTAFIGSFTNIAPKYSLYGDPSKGVLTRYHESKVYSEIPDVDFTREGILKLKIINEEDTIAVISRAVFDIYNVELYYKGNLASISAKMTVLPKETAKTESLDEPLYPEMIKATTLFNPISSRVLHKYFLMEAGYDG